MAKKDKPTTSRTCADCFHFCACHLWAVSISTDVAPQCPQFEPARYASVADLHEMHQMAKGELVPVVHGRWTYDRPNHYKCSECDAMWSGIIRFMYKGRYVALVEYDFNFDESAPNVRPVEYIRDMFKSGMFETEIANVICDEVFDPSIGNCKVTQTFFDMYEVENDEKS